MNKSQLQEATKTINSTTGPLVILTTFKYSSVGLDIKDMDTIVLADSIMSQLEQILGRIGRHGQTDLRIYDIVDTAIFVKRHFSTRKQVYTSKGYRVEVVEPIMSSYWP